jgi:hypothetical protein
MSSIIYLLFGQTCFSLFLLHGRLESMVFLCLSQQQRRHTAGTPAIPGRRALAETQATVATAGNPYWQQKTNIGNIRIDNSSIGDISLLAAGMPVTEETPEQGSGKILRVGNLTEAVNGSNTHNCP